MSELLGMRTRSGLLNIYNLYNVFSGDTVLKIAIRKLRDPILLRPCLEVLNLLLEIKQNARENKSIEIMASFAKRSLYGVEAKADQ